MDNNLSQFMQQSPLVGAAMFGADQNQNDLMQALKLAAEQEKNNQSQRMNPLLVQNQDLANQSLGAQIPGQRAQSQNLQTTADTAAATAPMARQATNAENANKVGDAATHDFSRQRTVMADAARMVAGEPDQMARRLKMGQILQQNKIDVANDPSAQQMMELAAKDPDNFIKLTDLVEQRHAKNSATYLTGVKGHEIAAEALKESRKYAADVQERIAGSKIAAGVGVKKVLSEDQEYNKKNTAADKLAYARGRYQFYKSAGNDELADHWADMANVQLEQANSQNPNAGAKPGTVALAGTTGGRVAENPSRPVQPIGPQRAASAPQSAASAPKVVTIKDFRAKYPMYDAYTDEALKVALKKQGIEVK